MPASTLDWSKPAAPHLPRQGMRQGVKTVAEKGGSTTVGGHEELDAARFAAAQIENFSAARISTLDSFCARLVRGHAYRFGIAPDFALDEERYSQQAEESALEFLFHHADDPTLARFLAINGFSRVLHDCLVRLAKSYCTLGRSIDWVELIEHQLGQLHEVLGHHLATLQQIADELCAVRTSSAALQRTQAAVATLNIGALVPGSSGQSSGQPIGVDELAAIGDLLQGIDALKKRGGRPGNENDVAIKDHIDRLREERQQIGAISSTLAAAGQLRELYALMGDFHARLSRDKRRNGLLYYQDVIDMATTLLREHASLRDYYARHFSHILIDELQDNNPAQQELLALLARDSDSNVLFLVGDEKQSIYRFRGADVSVFRRLASDVVEHGGQELRLARNYRSAPLLVELFNRLFSCIMPPTERDYEPTYYPIAAARRSAANAASAEIWYLPGTSAAMANEVSEEMGKETATEEAEELLTDDESEAFWIAHYIYRQVREQSLPVGDSGRPAQWGDFALLLRSTSKQQNYERMLRHFDIPYAVSGARSVYLEAPAYDLFALLQLACYPDDRAAYAALLRSPLAGLSDDALIALLQSDDAPFEHEAAELVDRLTAEDLERYPAIRDTWRMLGALVRYETAPALLDWFWYHIGYRYHLLATAGAHVLLDHFDSLFRLAAEHEAPLEFLDVLRARLGTPQNIREADQPSGARDSVRIMTIHQAKGLEFPVVIVANCGNPLRADSSASAPLYLDPDYGPVFQLSAHREGVLEAKRPNWFYLHAKEENRRRDLAEIKRTLYVAATRAESHLIISGVLTRRNRTLGTHHLGMVLDALGWDREKEPFGPAMLPAEAIATLRRLEPVPLTRLRRERLDRLQERRPASGPKRRADMLALYQGLPLVEYEVTRTHFSATQLNDRWIELYRNQHGDFAARRLPALGCDDLLVERRPRHTIQRSILFGRLCHRLIEAELIGRPEMMATILPASGFDTEELERILPEAQRLARRFLESQAPVVGPEYRVECEIGFLLRLVGAARPRVIQGAIDLLCVGEGRARVIDFKSDQTAADQRYAVQLELYRRAAERLCGLPCSAAVFWLRDASMTEMPANELPEMEELY